jgi:hypothetical protein
LWQIISSSSHLEKRDVQDDGISASHWTTERSKSRNSYESGWSKQTAKHLDCWTYTTSKVALNYEWIGIGIQKGVNEISVFDRVAQQIPIASSILEITAWCYIGRNF